MLFRSTSQDAVVGSGRNESVYLKAMFRRGKAYAGIGEADAAWRDFQKCLELEPTNADAAQQVVWHKLDKIEQIRRTPILLETLSKRESWMGAGRAI